MLAKITNNEVVPPSVANPLVTGELERLLKRLLATSPEIRPPSAEAARALLAAVRAGQTDIDYNHIFATFPHQPFVLLTLENEATSPQVMASTDDGPTLAENIIALDHTEVDDVAPAAPVAPPSPPILENISPPPELDGLLGDDAKAGAAPTLQPEDANPPPPQPSLAAAPSISANGPSPAAPAPAPRPEAPLFTAHIEAFNQPSCAESDQKPGLAPLSVAKEPTHHEAAPQPTSHRRFALVALAAMTLLCLAIYFLRRPVAMSTRAALAAEPNFAPVKASDLQRTTASQGALDQLASNGTELARATGVGHGPLVLASDTTAGNPTDPTGDGASPAETIGGRLGDSGVAPPRLHRSLSERAIDHQTTDHQTTDHHTTDHHDTDQHATASPTHSAALADDPFHPPGLIVATPAAAAEAPNAVLPVRLGTLVQVALLDTLDTSAGTPVRAQLLKSLPFGDQEQRIPAGSVVFGRAGLDLSNGIRGRARFDRVVYPDGSSHKIFAVAVRDDGSEGFKNARFENGDDDSDSSAASSGLKTAGEVATSALSAIPGVANVLSTAQVATNAIPATTGAAPRPKKRDRLVVNRDSELTLLFAPPALYQ